MKDIPHVTTALYRDRANRVHVRVRQLLRVIPRQRRRRAIPQIISCRGCKRLGVGLEKFGRSSYVCLKTGVTCFQSLASRAAHDSHGQSR